MLIEMVVAGLTIDPVNNAPIVILREKESDRVLPIWIGVIEASAIAFELEKVKLTRPMAHDLMKEAVTRLGGEVKQVSVVDLRDNTYYATVLIARAEESIEIDARPSDAIALALRAKAPILCDERVIELAHQKKDAEDRAQAAPRAEEPALPRKEPETPSDDEAERGDNGPLPILADAVVPPDLLEHLEPEAFGKYKM